MKKIIILFLHLVIVTTIFAQNKYESYMQKCSENSSFNGTVLVADESGVLYKGAFGYADIEWQLPNSIDTKFRLASVSKQFAATMIMKLVGAGKLTLETKLSEVLDYYRKDTGSKVTIKHLLNHTSGIPSYTNLDGFMRKEALFSYNTKEFVEKFCSNDLEFEPGEKYSYNNSGYFLLGAIVEKLYGMPYGDAVKKEIFEPLEMNNSGYDSNSEIISKRAHGYMKRFTNYRNSHYLDMTVPGAAGGLYSTVEDMFKWDRALLNGEILSQSLQEQMYTPGKGSYGFGWGIGKYKANDSSEYRLIQHSGGINGFSTFICRVPEKEFVAVLLTNIEGSPLDEITQQLLNIYFNDTFEVPKKSVAEYAYELYKKDNTIDLAGTINQLLKEEPELFSKNEKVINSLGYEFLYNLNMPKVSLEVFKLNTELYPESANAWDSFAEGLLAVGDTNASVKNYKKSLEINPANNNAVEILKNLGVDVKTKEVIVPQETLNKYVGEYQLAPNFSIVVTTSDGHIYAEATGQGNFEIFPLSQTKFFVKVVDAQVEFLMDENGNTKSLILFQGGRELPGVKIK